MYYLILLLISIIILFAIFYIALGGDIFSPSVIMCIIFLISTFIAVLNGSNWRIDYCFEAYFVLVTGILIFGVTEIIISIVAHRQKNIVNRNDKCQRIIRISQWKIIITIVFDVCILFLYYQGMKNVVSESGFNMSNIQYNYRRITSYEGTASMSIVILMLVKFMDAAAYVLLYVFINNTIVEKERLKKNIFLLIPVGLFCVKTLLSGGRQDILRIAFFGIVASYILYQQKLSWKRKVATKYIFVGICAFFIMIPLFYYALNLTGRESSRTLFQVVSTYVGGSIQHFNQYIQNPIEKSEYFGNETLTPILNMLGKMGIIEYHNTVHLEFRKLGVTIGNVYTFFRRPLQDFGIVGMYFFTTIVSLLFSILYHFKIKTVKTCYKQDMMNMVYCYIFYWIMLSSIEQYSMTIISAYTVLAIIFMRVMSCFYYKIEIYNFKIRFRRVANEE